METDEISNDEQDSVIEDRNKSCEIIQAKNGYVVITDHETLIALSIGEAIDIVKEVLS